MLFVGFSYDRAARTQGGARRMKEGRWKRWLLCTRSASSVCTGV